MPALLTSTSMRPKRACAASTSASMSCQRPTWQAWGIASRPDSDCTSRATASQASSLRLAMMTSAPARAKPSTIARPRPRLPPVTRATLPSSTGDRSAIVIEAALVQLAAARGRRRAVLLVRTQQVAADGPAMHFVRAVDEALRADARVPAGERRVFAVAERAVELDRGVDDLVHHVRQEDLRDRVLLPQVHALLRFVGDVQEHQPRHVQLARAIGEHPLHALALGERLAEGRALEDALRRHVERPLRHRDVVHAVTQAPVGETVLAHVEAVADAADDVLVRHDEVDDLDLRVTAAERLAETAFAGHGLDVADDLIAGVRQFDEERAELLVARRIGVGLRHHHRDVGDAGAAAEPLLAVEHPVVAVADG